MKKKDASGPGGTISQTHAAEIATAQKKADAAKKTAKAAKAAYKEARKKFKVARKEAKAARKAVKALKAEFAAPELKKPGARKSAAKPRSIPDFIPAPEVSEPGV
jgi:uncharacterized coiled-coil DUF342 family protein